MHAVQEGSRTNVDGLSSCRGSQPGSQEVSVPIPRNRQTPAHAKFQQVSLYKGGVEELECD